MDEDEKIAELLRQGAPPTHDPLFRLSVLERREQKRFRNWSLLLAAGTVALIGAAWISIALGAGLELIGFVVLGAVAVVAVLNPSLAGH